jgi:hypothetical protein
MMGMIMGMMVPLAESAAACFPNGSQGEIIDEPCLSAPGLAANKALTGLLS